MLLQRRRSMIAGTVIVFDLDGVITSEEAYWDAAGLTLHELMFSPQHWALGPGRGGGTGRALARATLPESEISALKSRGVNSNWDVCHLAASLRLIAALRGGIGAALVPLEPWSASWLKRFRPAVEPGVDAGDVAARARRSIDEGRLAGATGFALIDGLDAYASEVLGLPVAGVFGREAPLWAWHRQLFQEWFLGDRRFRERYGRAPSRPGRPGCFQNESLLFPAEQIRSALQALAGQGFVLGVATGRPASEATPVLARHGLLALFDSAHVATDDDVLAARALGKPDPFIFRHAAGRGDSWGRTRPFIVIGDSVSDIMGGRAAGALTVAVLSGSRTRQARSSLIASGADFTIEDVTRLPGLVTGFDRLEVIQELQLTARETAERLLRLWFARHLDWAVDSVELRPRPFSLNSFNGLVTAAGEERFFKTHVETDATITEYYNAGLLASAGYNTVVPLRVERLEGRQMVVYPVVRWPVMFDLAREVETGIGGGVEGRALLDAERREAARLLTIYEATMELSDGDEHALAPVHQLFWHRLRGGRLTRFYSGASLELPGGDGAAGAASVAMAELFDATWTVNGARAERTLGELIDLAGDVLSPNRAGATVIGHGDAHWGNVFLANRRDFLYFDPAFAGRHSPLLDIAKPLFHNVFAAWMYFPREVAAGIDLTVVRDGPDVAIEHGPPLSDLRRDLLAVKLEFLVFPLLTMLESRGRLPGDWREMLRSALMCCALLTMNLCDRKRFPAAIGWLGLGMAVEMGNHDVWTIIDSQPHLRGKP